MSKRVKTRAEIRAAYNVMDRWFESNSKRVPEVGNQIKGAHATLAWILGIDIPGSVSMDTNLKHLKDDIAGHKK